MPTNKKVTRTALQTSKWIRSIMRVLLLDFFKSKGRKWDPEDKRILRNCIDRASIGVGKGPIMAGCDAWVELGKTPTLKFAETPSCSWIQVIAHELAHVICWVRTGDGISHDPVFFTNYRILLTNWFLSTETVQFVVMEHVICEEPNEDDDDDLAKGPENPPDPANGPYYCMLCKNVGCPKCEGRNGTL